MLHVVNYAVKKWIITNKSVENNTGVIMRLIKICIIFNIFLILVLFYTIFLYDNDVKIGYLKDITGKKEEVGISMLADYEIAIEYIESNLPKETIVYTKPASGELVYENQMVTLYISKGYVKEKYKNLENRIYDDCIDYLNGLKKDYKLEITITYKNSKTQLDGLIYQQKVDDEFIDMNDKMLLVVISNPKTVKIPDFIGWFYKDVLKYAKENEINVTFEYISILYPVDYVVGQSILKGQEVLKNSNPITIYLAKEN